MSINSNLLNTIVFRLQSPSKKFQRTEHGRTSPLLLSSRARSISVPSMYSIAAPSPAIAATVPTHACNSKPYSDKAHTNGGAAPNPVEQMLIESVAEEGLMNEWRVEHERREANGGSTESMQNGGNEYYMPEGEGHETKLQHSTAACSASITDGAHTGVFEVIGNTADQYKPQETGMIDISSEVMTCRAEDFGPNIQASNEPITLMVNHGRVSNQGYGTSLAGTVSDQGYATSLAGTVSDQGVTDQENTTSLAGTVSDQGYGTSLAGTVSDQGYATSLAGTVSDQGYGTSLAGTVSDQGYATSLAGTVSDQGVTDQENTTSLAGTVSDQGYAASLAGTVSDQGYGTSLAGTVSDQGYGTSLAGTVSDQGVTDQENTTSLAGTVSDQGYGTSLAGTVSDQGVTDQENTTSLAGTVSNQGYGTSLAGTVSDQGYGTSLAGTVSDQGVSDQENTTSLAGTVSDQGYGTSLAGTVSDQGVTDQENTTSLAGTVSNQGYATSLAGTVSDQGVTDQENTTSLAGTVSDQGYATSLAGTVSDQGVTDQENTTSLAGTVSDQGYGTSLAGTVSDQGYGTSLAGTVSDQGYATSLAGTVSDQGVTDQENTTSLAGTVSDQGYGTSLAGTVSDQGVTDQENTTSLAGTVSDQGYATSLAGTVTNLWQITSLTKSHDVSSDPTLLTEDCESTLLTEDHNSVTLLTDYQPTTIAAEDGKLRMPKVEDHKLATALTGHHGLTLIEAEDNGGTIPRLTGPGAGGHGMTNTAAEDHTRTIPPSEDHKLTIVAAEDNRVTIRAAEGNELTLLAAESHVMTIPAAEDHEITTSQTGYNRFATFCAVSEPQLTESPGYQPATTLTTDHMSRNGDNYSNGLMHTTIAIDDARTDDQLSVCEDQKYFTAGSQGFRIVQLPSSLAVSHNEVQGDHRSSEIITTPASDKVACYSSVSAHRVMMTQSASDKDTTVITTPDLCTTVTTPDKDTKVDQTECGSGVECRDLKDHARTELSVALPDCALGVGEGQLYSSQPSGTTKTMDVAPLEASSQQQRIPNPFKPMSMQEVCLATENSSDISLYGRDLADPAASKNRGALRRTHVSSLPLHTVSNTHTSDPVKMGQTSLVRMVARYIPLRQCVFVISVAAVLSILVLGIGFSVSEGNKPM